MKTFSPNILGSRLVFIDQAAQFHLTMPQHSVRLGHLLLFEQAMSRFSTATWLFYTLFYPCYNIFFDVATFSRSFFSNMPLDKFQFPTFQIQL